MQRITLFTVFVAIGAVVAVPLSTRSSTATQHHSTSMSPSTTRSSHAPSLSTHATTSDHAATTAAHTKTALPKTSTRSTTVPHSINQPATSRSPSTVHPSTSSATLAATQTHASTMTTTKTPAPATTAARTSASPSRTTTTHAKPTTKALPTTTKVVSPTTTRPTTNSKSPTTHAAVQTTTATAARTQPHSASPTTTQRQATTAPTTPTHATSMHTTATHAPTSSTPPLLNTSVGVDPLTRGAIITSLSESFGGTAPAGFGFPFGVTSFTATTPFPGGLVTFVLTYNCAVNVVGVFKSTDGGATWQEFVPAPDGTKYVLLGAVGGPDAAHDCGVAVTVQDNGRGDTDPRLGFVSDPVALAVISTTTTTTAATTTTTTTPLITSTTTTTTAASTTTTLFPPFDFSHTHVFFISQVYNYPTGYAFVIMSLDLDQDFTWNQETYFPDNVGVSPSAFTPGTGALAYVNGSLYVFGAGSNGNTTANFLIYSFVSRTWSVGSVMPTERVGGAATVAGQSIYLCGGTDFNGTALASCDCYDTGVGAWNVGRTPAPMNNARATLTLVTFDSGHLYALGDVVFNGTAVGSVERYDIALNTWTFVRPLPQPTSSAAYGVVNGTLYGTGGYFSGGFYDVFPSSNVMRYDPASDTWELTSFVPNPVEHAFAVADARYMYVLAGTVFGLYGQQSSNYVQQFDSLTGAWNVLYVYFPYELARIPGVLQVGDGAETTTTTTPAASTTTAPSTTETVPLGNSSAAPPSPRIFFAAGDYGEAVGSITTMSFQRDSSCCVFEASVPNPTIYSYDVVAQTWNTELALSGIPSYMSAAYCGDKIYFAGASALFIYDIASHGLVKGPDMLGIRYVAAATCLNDVVYVCGGLDINGTALTSCERFDTHSSTWSMAAKMNSERASFSLVELSGNLYAVGDFVHANTTVERYDPTLDAWSYVQSLPTSVPEGTSFVTAAALQGHLYACDIKGNTFKYLAHNDEWIVVAGVPTPVGFAPLVADDNFLYLMGGRGYSDGVPSGDFYSFWQMQRYDPAADSWNPPYDWSLALQPFYDETGDLAGAENLLAVVVM